jgi:hypothetical protein
MKRDRYISTRSSDRTERLKGFVIITDYQFVITASSFVTNIPVLSSMATASKRNYEKLTTKNIA